MYKGSVPLATFFPSTFNYTFPWWFSGLNSHRGGQGGALMYQWLKLSHTTCQYTDGGIQASDREGYFRNIPLYSLTVPISHTQSQLHLVISKIISIYCFFFFLTPQMDEKNKGWSLNIGQIMVDFSSLQENFMQTKKKIKVNTGIQECTN